MKRIFRWPPIILTIAADIVMLPFIAALAYYLRFETWIDATQLHAGYGRTAFSTIPLMAFAMLVSGNYKDNLFSRLRYTTGLAMKGFALYFFLSVTAIFIFQWNEELARGFAALFYGLVGAGLILSRWFVNLLKKIAIRPLAGNESALIYGDSADAYRVADIMVNHVLGRYELAGFVFPGVDAKNMPPPAPGLKWYNRADAIEAFEKRKIDRLFIPSADYFTGQLTDLIEEATKRGVGVRVTVRTSPGITYHIHKFQDVLGFDLPEDAAFPECKTPVLKRAFDLVFAGLILLFMIPAFLAIALISKIDSKGPVFFRQTRLTVGGRRFRLYKFRSMRLGAEKELKSLALQSQASGPIFKIFRDPRVTRFGRFLRKFSLDEFPQLFNVIAGEMSLVGPRPPIPEEVERYEPWQKRRLAIIGGMTGLWQTTGRSHLTFDEMASIDLYYIENWSLFLDMEIMYNTIFAVAASWGSY